MLSPPMVVIGLGNGTSVRVVIGVVMQSVREGAGMVSGILTTAQQFASAAGVAGIGAVFFGTLRGGEGLGAHVRAMAVSCSTTTA